MTDEELLDVLKATTTTNDARERLVAIVRDDAPSPACHRWASHLPEEIAPLWGRLSVGQRVVAYLAARERETDALDRLG